MATFTPLSSRTTPTSSPRNSPVPLMEIQVAPPALAQKRQRPPQNSSSSENSPVKKTFAEATSNSSSTLSLNEIGTDSTRPKTPMESTPEPAVIYMKCIDDTENIVSLAQNDPLKFKDEFERNFGTPDKIDFHRKNKCIKITCTSLQAAALLSADRLLGTPVQATKPRHATQPPTQTTSAPPTYKAVIHHVPLHLTDQTIVEATNALAASRLTRRDPHSNARTPSQSVLLAFASIPPTRVSIGWINYKTDVYVPTPMRCSKCQRLGHTATHCRSNQVRCSFCSGQHAYSECTNRTASQPTPKCTNCGGPHSAAWSECPAYQARRATLTYQFTHHVSYRDAVLRTTAAAQPTPPSTSAPAHTPVSNRPAAATMNPAHSTASTPVTAQQTTPTHQSNPNIPATLDQQQRSLVSLYNTITEQGKYLEELAQRFNALLQDVKNFKHTITANIAKQHEAYEQTVQTTVLKELSAQRELFGNLITTLQKEVTALTATLNRPPSSSKTSTKR